MKFEKVYILDTNVILGDANHILTIGENGKNLIVLPETVIDELDKKKSGFNEINYQAREFGRLLADAELELIRKEEILDDAGDKKNEVTIMTLSLRDIYIDIISFENYDDLKDVDPKIRNDRKIISVAQFASEYYRISKDTELLSDDIMCRTRAISLGVKASGVTPTNEILDAEFIKVLSGLKSGAFNSMQHKDIQDYDPNYKPENYCYHFKATDGNQKIAYIVNEKIHFIPDNHFKAMAVQPLNMGQKFAMAGMLDECIDVCVVEALAGSGKTLLAIAAGMKMVKQGKYDKIIYIRNSVESVDKAEEIGFLPGLEEKFKIYNYPLYDTLSFIATRSNKKQTQEKTDEKIESMVDKFNIETLWPGAMRGRTISSAFVIVDEVQNFAKTSLQTVLSRLDKDCKLICIGSNRQIDHPYINKFNNGLSVVLRASKEKDPDVNMFGTILNRSVRGKITQWTERIFEKK